MPYLDPYISYFARVDFRDRNELFGIYQSDRLMGMYLLGKTGSGKTNLMKVLLHQDIVHGRGCCLMDINGDFISQILELIPERRKKDVVFLDTSDEHIGIGYNPLKKVSHHKRALIASSILETFQMLWGKQSWGLKLEYILRNTLLTLLDQSEATFNDIPKLLLDDEFRASCIPQIINENVQRFWTSEFPKYTKADILPVLNKVGGFLSIPMVKKILIDNKKQISLRSIMDGKKILMISLSKGSLGADGAHLLASILITALASAGFTRIDTKEKDRIPFIIYLDEFQNYTTGSIATMLSELRKFGLGFVLAHQYLHQLTADIRNAVLGNIGTIICFRLGQADAKYMAAEFTPIFHSSDFTNLGHFHIYLKLLINGKTSVGFSAKTVTLEELNNKSDV